MLETMGPRAQPKDRPQRKYSQSLSWDSSRSACYRATIFPALPA